MTLKTSKPQWVSPTLQNPLVTRLNIIRDKNAFMSQVELRPDKQFDFYGVDARERKRVFGSEFYDPCDFVWDFYTAVSEMIEFGYRYKNIAYPSFYAEMNRAIMGDEKLAATIESEHDLDMGGAIIGPSGAGKSEAIKRSLAMFPETILHPAKDTAYQKPFLQIPFIKADINGRSTISLLQNLMAAIDKKAGTNYYDDNPSRKGEGQLIEVIANACWQHGIGLVVLDEAQAFITENGKKSGKDSPNAKFLQRLFNSLKVPVLLIGTPELEDFLSCNPHTLRRYKKDADITLKNHHAESEYWKSLVETIIQEYVFCREVNVSETHHRQIYTYTAGNYSALQIYCQALIVHVEAEGVEFLSESLLKNVYEQKKSVINKLAWFHQKPVPDFSLKVPKPTKSNTRQAVPLASSDTPESKAEQQSRELGRAAHELFRKV